MKTIKKFNGNWGTNSHAYVGAYSQKHAVELLNKASDCRGYMTISQLQKYWSKNCWGNAMNGIEPQIGVWIQDAWNGPVKKVI
jgi:hypothetical protein